MDRSSSRRRARASTAGHASPPPCSSVPSPPSRSCRPGVCSAPRSRADGVARRRGSVAPPAAVAPVATLQRPAPDGAGLPSVEAATEDDAFAVLAMAGGWRQCPMWRGLGGGGTIRAVDGDTALAQSGPERVAGMHEAPDAAGDSRRFWVGGSEDDAARGFGGTAVVRVASEVWTAIPDGSAWQAVRLEPLALASTGLPAWQVGAHAYPAPYCTVELVGGQDAEVIEVPGDGDPLERLFAQSGWIVCRTWQRMGRTVSPDVSAIDAAADAAGAGDGPAWVTTAVPASDGTATRELRLLIDPDPAHAATQHRSRLVVARHRGATPCVDGGDRSRGGRWRSRSTSWRTPAGRTAWIPTSSAAGSSATARRRPGHGWRAPSPPPARRRMRPTHCRRGAAPRGAERLRAPRPAARLDRLPDGDPRALRAGDPGRGDRPRGRGPGVEAGPLQSTVEGATQPVPVFVGRTSWSSRGSGSMPVVALDGRPVLWLADETITREWQSMITPAGRTAWVADRRRGVARRRLRPAARCRARDHGLPVAHLLDGPRPLPGGDRGGADARPRRVRARGRCRGRPRGPTLPRPGPVPMDGPQRPGPRHGDAVVLDGHERGAGLLDGPAAALGRRERAAPSTPWATGRWRSHRCRRSRSRSPRPGTTTCAGDNLHGPLAHGPGIRVSRGSTRCPSAGPRDTWASSCRTCGSLRRTGRSWAGRATSSRSSRPPTAMARRASSSPAASSPRAPGGRDGRSPAAARYAAPMSLRPDLVECWLFRVAPPASPATPAPTLSGSRSSSSGGRRPDLPGPVAVRDRRRRARRARADGGDPRGRGGDRARPRATSRAATTSTRWRRSSTRASTGSSSRPSSPPGSGPTRADGVSHEHDALRWVPAAEAPALAIWPSYADSVRRIRDLLLDPALARWFEMDADGRRHRPPSAGVRTRPARRAGRAAR